MLKEVQPPRRVLVLGQPLCPHGMGDSWHLSCHSLPAVGSPQPCAWRSAPRISRQALPHAGAMVWSEPLPQTRANPSSSRAGCRTWLSLPALARICYTSSWKDLCSAALLVSRETLLHRANICTSSHMEAAAQNKREFLRQLYRKTFLKS